MMETAKQQKLTRDRVVLLTFTGALLLAAWLWWHGGLMWQREADLRLPSMFHGWRAEQLLPAPLTPQLAPGFGSVLLTALLAALVGWLGYELGGTRGHRWTSLAALLGTPLFGNAVASPARALALLLWVTVAILAARLRHGYNRLYTVAVGVAIGTVAAGNVVFILAAIMLALYMPRPGRMVFLLTVGAVVLLLLNAGLPSPAPLRQDIRDAVTGLDAAGRGAGRATDWLYQAQRLAELNGAAAANRYLLGQTLRFAAASPSRMVELWGRHAVDVLRPRPYGDHYPWNIALAATWPFSWYPPWAMIITLAAFGFAAVSCEQRWLAALLLLPPLCASVLLVPGSQYRGMLYVALAYLAARGCQEMLRRVDRWKRLTVALAAVVLLAFGLLTPPDAGYWRGMAILHMQREEWPEAARAVDVWLADAPRDYEAWLASGLLAADRGDVLRMQRDLLRSVIWAPPSVRQSLWEMQGELMARSPGGAAPAGE